MKTTTFTESNYVNNYTTYQLSLPLDVSFLIDDDNMVVSFLKAIEGVNLCKYLKREELRGRKGHDNVMLLKVLLFAYTLGIRSLRKIEDACKNDVRFMYLAQNERPSHMAFDRMMKNYLINDIDDIFFEISHHIAGLMDIDTNIQYIDGTKIEANANKYSFVYRKRIENSRKKMSEKITDLIENINSRYGYDFPVHEDTYCAQELGYICQYLMEVMNHENIEPIYGKGQRKSSIQRDYDKMLGFYGKFIEYEFWLFVIGDSRWSCSKTDHDATMHALKIDYYCRTGLSRPSYNAQIAVSGGLIINAALYQQAGDTSTFIPFMMRYYEHMGEFPEYPMADAGYGSYDNYMFCVEKGMKPVMKYNYYAKKNESAFKKQIFNVMNWQENEDGNKICPNGHVFDTVASEKDENTKAGYAKHTKFIKSCETCVGCPLKDKCMKNAKADTEKIIRKCDKLEEFHEYVDNELSTEFGKELKKQRSIQVEGAFGVLKQDMDFTRFTRKGLKNAQMEFLLVCLGYNFRKYHKYLNRINKNIEVN